MSTSPAIIDSFLGNLQKELESISSKEKYFRAIVDAPFYDKYNSTLLGLGFLAFLLVNKKEGMLDRITISNTNTALGAINMTSKRFEDMRVPLNHRGNIVLTAIKTGHYQQTTNWHYLTDPAVTEEESRMNQAAAGISTSIVYPLVNTKTGGAIIFQYYIEMHEISTLHREFMFRYSKLVSKSLDKFL